MYKIKKEFECVETAWREHYDSELYTQFDVNIYLYVFIYRRKRW
jgi:hypothetical protein